MSVRRPRARGHGMVALAFAGVVVLTGVAFDRLGPAVPEPAPAGGAVSTASFCPHGGGKGWTGTLALANPGDRPVDARVTSLGRDEPADSVEVTVPAGGEVLHDVPADTRASSTFVESFGGWLAAGWIVRSEDPVGIGTEPCATLAGRSWYLAAPTTQQGRDAYLVVMNPFFRDAVLDVSLFSGGAPIRDTRFHDLVVPARRSASLKLDAAKEGAGALGVELDARVGRVAVASLGVGVKGSGVSSVLGTTQPAQHWVLPTSSGTGRATLVVFTPGESNLRVGATLMSDMPFRPLQDLTAAEEAASSARGYPVVSDGSSAVDLLAEGEGVVTALRAIGQSDDDAATGGTSLPGPAWVVLPTVVAEPWSPGLVLANPGESAVHVTLRLLPSAAGAATHTTTVRVGPTSAVGAPEGFLEHDPRAAVLVTADGDVVALGASTSLGVRGISLYGLSMGVPLPSGSVP
jgi:hypothetical protein